MRCHVQYGINIVRVMFKNFDNIRATSHDYLFIITMTKLHTSKVQRVAKALEKLLWNTIFIINIIFSL